MTDLLLSLVPFVRDPQGGLLLISPVFCISHVAPRLRFDVIVHGAKDLAKRKRRLQPDRGWRGADTLSTKDAMTWLRLRERLGLTTRKRPQPKLREIPGLRSRRKQPAPRPSKRPGPGPSKRLRSRRSERLAPGPSKRLEPRPSKRPEPRPRKRPGSRPSKRLEPRPSKRPASGPSKRSEPRPRKRPGSRPKKRPTPGPNKRLRSRPSKRFR